MSHLLRLDRQAVHAQCPSTQPLCLALAEQGAPTGTVVWSWEQTEGRGRGDHEWSSPPESGLWMSFVLRPTVPLEAWPAYTGLVACAAAEAIEELVPVSVVDAVQIKWPNDLYGRRGKLGGVLAQTVPGGLVVGLGINVWQQDEDFPPSLRGRATSLVWDGRLALVPRTTRRDVIVELAESFDRRLAHWYRCFEEGDRGSLRTALRARFYLRGCEVEIIDGTRRHQGRATDLGPLGELMVESAAGIALVRSGALIRHGRAEAK